ncbi:MAG: NfeD family protein, partial [Bacteroidales bacterium]|nr:NfeD family protein [Bacteroidales bacterium]
LDTNINSKVDSAPQEKGIAVGDSGVALTRLAPAGKVRFGENVVEAFTRDTLVEPGKNVAVSSIEGNKIYVKEM